MADAYFTVLDFVCSQQWASNSKTDRQLVDTDAGATSYCCNHCVRIQSGPQNKLPRFVVDADTLYHAVTLTFDLLILKVRGTSSVAWSKSVRNLSDIEQCPVKLLIILWIFAHVMSRHDLDLWPLDLELLQHFGCHASKLCTKFEPNRIIHGWVIDDLARFRVQFLGVGQNWQSFLRGAWIQLHQTWLRHRAIITALHFCFRILIYCCIFKRWQLKFEWCLKWRQI